MSERYSRKAIEHFMNPRNLGDLDGATGKGRAINSAQDVVTFSVKGDAEKITEAQFQAQGCAACIASASVATELIVGRSLDEAAQVADLDVLAEALDGLPNSKRGRAKVTIAAIRVALEEHGKSVA